MRPPDFRSVQLPKVLNVLAVGAALGAVTGPVLGLLLDPGVALASGLSSAAVGAAWAWLLRVRATAGRSKIRWAWFASVPLAILNTWLAQIVVDLFDPDRAPESLASLLFALVAASTIGAIIWLPALTLTLLFFGVPIAKAQRLARQGLAGEERGDRAVGTASAVLGAIGAFLCLFLPGHASLTLEALAVFAIAMGISAAWLAASRERRRSAFVGAVERGEIPGYRVDASPEGKVLVRVSHIGGYRDPEKHEALVELDDQGRATRTVAT